MNPTGTRRVGLDSNFNIYQKYELPNEIPRGEVPAYHEPAAFSFPFLFICYKQKRLYTMVVIQQHSDLSCIPMCANYSILEYNLDTALIKV